MKKLVMEFLGTFFLVLTIAVTGNPFAIAAMLMAWVYLGGYISGAHYNPAVSLAVAVRGGISWRHAIEYMIAQIIGGFAGFALASYLTGHFAIPAPAANATLQQALVVEVLLAFVLAFVVLTVATAPVFKDNRIFGFAIGFTVPALAALGTPISGGLFNPAIALGASLLGAFKSMPVLLPHVTMYVGGAAIGGLLAAYAFNYFGLDTKKP